MPNDIIPRRKRRGNGEFVRRIRGQRVRRPGAVSMLAILRDEEPHGGGARVVRAAVAGALGHVGVDGAFVRVGPEGPG